MLPFTSITPSILASKWLTSRFSMLPCASIFALRLFCGRFLAMSGLMPWSAIARSSFPSVPSILMSNCPGLVPLCGVSKALLSIAMFRFTLDPGVCRWKLSRLMRRLSIANVPLDSLMVSPLRSLPERWLMSSRMEPSPLYSMAAMSAFIPFMAICAGSSPVAGVELSAPYLTSVLASAMSLNVKRSLSRSIFPESTPFPMSVLTASLSPVFMFIFDVCILTSLKE